MLHVFLDTNILSAAPRLDSAALRSLEFLAVSGEASIHISEVTAREFMTQQQAAIEKSASSMSGSLQDLRRHLPVGVAVPSEIEIVQEAIASLVEQAQGLGESGMTEWIQRSNVLVHQPQPTHLAPVLDGYFSGAPPFKNKKSRADFPDAYIFESLKLDVPRPLHAVVNDAYLRECASHLDGVTTYGSLSEFIAAPVVQERIANAKVKQNVRALMSELIEAASRADRAIEDQLVDVLHGRTFESPQIPDDNNTATIGSVGTPRDITYDVDAAEYYGDGVILIPFGASIEAYGEYYLFKADYYAIGDQRASRMSVDDWNNHYFSVEESLMLDIEGTLSMAVAPDALSGELDVLGLRELLATAAFEVDDVDEIRHVLQEFD